MAITTAHLGIMAHIMMSAVCAGYIAINISSPNTKNLRQLQGESELDNLLSQLKNAQDRLAQQHARYVPLALKIAPDIDDNQIRNIADALLRHHIDGVIATNTTISRNTVNHLPHGAEAGGSHDVHPLEEEGQEVEAHPLLRQGPQHRIPLVVEEGH